MNYFNLAAHLARQEGAKTLAQVAIKSIALKSMRNRGSVCGCSAYHFLHRVGSGSCPGQSLREINQEELSVFDRNEAQWINGGAL